MKPRHLFYVEKRTTSIGDIIGGTDGFPYEITAITKVVTVHEGKAPVRSIIHTLLSLVGLPVVRFHREGRGEINERNKRKTR